MFKRRIHNWHLIKGQPVTDLDRKILAEQEKGEGAPGSQTKINQDPGAD